jgi:hypothetical protein
MEKRFILKDDEIREMTEDEKAEYEAVIANSPSSISFE